MKRLFRFRIFHLVILIALVALGLGYLSWTGFFFRNGVWQVTAITGNQIWYHGEDPATGQPWFETDIEFVATCRDGDLTRDLSLGLYGVIGSAVETVPPELPLSVGDSFRFAKSPSEAGSILLPDGELIVKTKSAETSD